MLLFARNRQILLNIILLTGVLSVRPVLAQPLVPAADGTGTTVTLDGNRFDISGGKLSGDSANLFHSFEHFNVDAGQIANFLSTPQIRNILTRVVGGDASLINGLLQITGGNPNLYLMNPAGIVFGPNASLNVPASFFATTATGIGFGPHWFNAVGANDWENLAGTPSHFALAGLQPGAIVNAGNLTVSSGQTLALVGGSVVNTGTLNSAGGNIAMTAVPGENLVRISQAGHLLSLEVSPLSQHSTAPTPLPFTPLSLPQLLVGKGVDSASGVSVDANGQVILTASNSLIPSQTGTAIAAGQIDTSNPLHIGGNIQVLGDRVGVIDAQLKANGINGGGIVLIGGDYQGKGTVPTALRTYVSRNSWITADSVLAGDGGRVIVWADDTTGFYGNITAKGGTASGNGGFVEVSGKQNLVFTGTVDLTAPNGNLGTLLLDPVKIIVINGTGSEKDDALLDDGQILLDEGDGTFTISQAALEKASGNANIILEAADEIQINNLQDGELTFAPGTGTITFRADADGNGQGDFSMKAEDTIRTQGRSITIFGVQIVLGNINSSVETGVGGNINLEAKQGFSANSLVSSGSLGAGSISLTGQQGSGIVTNINATSTNGNGGSVSVSTATGIDIQSITTRSDNGIGGNTILKTATDLTVSTINASGTTGGGTVSLTTTSGNIVQPNSTGSINASSSGGVGGNVILNASGNLTLTNIDASGNQGGGSITATGQQVSVTPITATSPALNASSSAGNGGNITLSGTQITATQLNTTGASGGGKISLTADEVDLTGNNAITSANGTVEIKPQTANQPIRIGENQNVSGALTLTTTDLAALSSELGTLTIGGNGTGSITLDTNTTFNIPVNLAGGSTLTGPDRATTWTLTGSDRGNLSGYSKGLTFNNISNLQGGSLNDTFQFTANSTLSGNLSGGAGSNRLDYSNFGGSISFNLETNKISGVGGTVSGIDRVIGSTAGNNTLTGQNTTNTWTLTGNNSGSVSSLDFSNFQNLIGGNLDDSFALNGGNVASINGGQGNNTLSGNGNIANNWNITGENSGSLNSNLSFSNIQSLIGGSSTDTFKLTGSNPSIRSLSGAQATDTLDYSGYSGGNITVNLGKSNSSNVAPGVASVTGIETIIGNPNSTNTLIGDDTGNNWSITGTNQGDVNNTNFSNFQNLIGGSQTDRFVLSGGSVSSIDGGEGNNSLRGENTANTWNITGNNSGNLNGTITFRNIESLTGGEKTDNFNLNGGVVSRINGGEGNNTLQGDNTANTWNITERNTGNLNGIVTFSNIQNLTSGTAGNTFKFIGAKPAIDGNIAGNGTQDTLDYSTFNGNNTNISLGSKTPGSATVVGGTVTGIENVIGNLAFSNYLTGEDTNNTWTVTGPNSGTVNGINFSNFQNLIGNNSIDSFILQGGTVAYVDGGPGNNTLIGDNRNNTWNLNGTNSGTLGVTAFNNIGNLQGGNANDTFVFADGASIGGKIGGSPGTDTMDYTAYKTPVNVDLKAGIATGTGGISNIEGAIVKEPPTQNPNPTPTPVPNSSSAPQPEPNSPSPAPTATPAGNNTSSPTPTATPAGNNAFSPTPTSTSAANNTSSPTPTSTPVASNISSPAPTANPAPAPDFSTDSIELPTVPSQSPSQPTGTGSAQPSPTSGTSFPTLSTPAVTPSQVPAPGSLSPSPNPPTVATSPLSPLPSPSPAPVTGQIPGLPSSTPENLSVPQLPNSPEVVTSPVSPLPSPSPVPGTGQPLLSSSPLPTDLSISQLPNSPEAVTSPGSPLSSPSLDPTTGQSVLSPSPISVASGLSPTIQASSPAAGSSATQSSQPTGSPVGLPTVQTGPGVQDPTSSTPILNIQPFSTLTPSETHLGTPTPSTTTPLTIAGVKSANQVFQNSSGGAILQTPSILTLGTLRITEPSPLLSTASLSSESSTTSPTATTNPPSTASNSVDSKLVLRGNIERALTGGDLTEATKTLDLYFSQEYEEYLGQTVGRSDLSLPILQQQLRQIETTTRTRSAVIYTFVRPEQLDLILVPPTGTPIYKSIPAANSAALLEQVKRLHQQIADITRRRTTSYLPASQQLYQWMIAPLKADLEQLGIDTLIFCMDAGLRSLPVAMLHDGQQFLIEKYSLALIPSANLMDTRYAAFRQPTLLAMGMSQFADQQPLPAVPVEIQIAAQHLGSDRIFLNEAVTLNNLQQQRQNNPVSIVHIASHGQFQPGQRSNSYIQLWDGKLSLEQMRSLKWNDPPVELLVLSACRTAVGDREAELGFGGLAVQSGAKSALATLWYASDAGTLALMSEFYHLLQQTPIKAETLRQAQLAMLRGEIRLENGQVVGPFGKVNLPPQLASLGNRELKHPYYWAGFTLIGNPW